ncbi:hypothetical protein POM88_016377 [Heracleum sosnowskyi]|uniref:Uncharacterized protein n=1 Tax=Heracleum sosnowskyi TaxID=360622 RepID=A0AAD8IND7_9APIA|nr:hypothetical protein POM88_016377 [Heracleum sosnowskyi]
MWTEAWSGCFKKASNVQGGGSWISSGGVNLESGGNADVAGNGAHSQAHGADARGDFCFIGTSTFFRANATRLHIVTDNDPSRFRFAHQTSFVRRHSGLSTMPGVGYIVAFFRQFFASVTKVDYMTMRHGFINAHFAPNSKFNFHKYIKRSMEDDFMVVVGIAEQYAYQAAVNIGDHALKGFLYDHGEISLLEKTFKMAILVLLVFMEAKMLETTENAGANEYEKDLHFPFNLLLTVLVGFRMITGLRGKGYARYAGLWTDQQI